MFLLFVLLALPQMAGRIAHSAKMEESVFTDTLKMPTLKNHDGLASRRYLYPPYGSDKDFLIRPRCYDLRDEETGQGITSPVKNVTDRGFTIEAPSGHTIKITCRVVRAKGPLA